MRMLKEIVCRIAGFVKELFYPTIPDAAVRIEPVKFQHAIEDPDDDKGFRVEATVKAIGVIGGQVVLLYDLTISVNDGKAQAEMNDADRLFESGYASNPWRRRKAKKLVTSIKVNDTSKIERAAQDILPEALGEFGAYFKKSLPYWMLGAWLAAVVNAKLSKDS